MEKWMLVLLIWCCSLVAWVSGQKREDGILYDHTAIGLRPWYPLQYMRSNSFPNVSPHLLVQTWRYVAMPESGLDAAVKIICNKIFVPKVSGRNDCGEYSMTMEDGDDRRVFCGEVEPFTLLSRSDSIKFELHTGPNGGAFVDCTAKVIPVTKDRIEITTTTTTTTTTPRPTLPGYLTLESHEVDSSEHGGEEGDKKTSCACGWANKATSRIVNGMETKRNEFPFAVGLAYRGTRARFCGATIITRYHALTAAHCTDGKDAEYLSILVGFHNIPEDDGDPANEAEIDKVYQHKTFTRGIWLNDISLLVMKSEIKFNQFVGPACLPPANPKLHLDRQYIKIIGWGANYTMGPGSPILKKANVRVVPTKECHTRYPEIDVNNPLKLCTYADKKATCQGDSGGPVMWVDPETNRYTHVGIVSYGYQCGDTNPSVHTDVQSYLDWIYQHIRESNKPNSQTCVKIN